MKAYKKTADSEKLPSGIFSSFLIQTRPSRILLGAVLFMHGCAVAGIVLADLPWIAQCIGASGIFFMAANYYRQWWTTPYFHLQKNLKQQWVFCSEQGEGQELTELTIDACYYWSRYLLIFRVRDRQSRSLFYPVLADACDGDGHRHLRVFAKFFL